MDYLKYFKRLLKFEKYPLFRTVPFKYLLLNILIIGILLSVPYMLSFFNTNQFANALSEVKDEIPHFEIKDGYYVGDEKTLTTSKGRIVFTEESLPLEDAFIIFQHQGIQIHNMTEDYLPYSIFNKFNNENELKQYIDTHTKSTGFFFAVYSIIQIIVMAAFSFTLLLLLSFILNKIASMRNKRTDYMNWFKIISYSFVIPTILFTILKLITGKELWFIYIIVLIFLIYYDKKLPVFKKKQTIK